MALIRVTRSYDRVDPAREHDVILNTEHIVAVYPDSHEPPRGVCVQLVSGEPVLVKLTFEEMWTLFQRET